MSIVIYMGYGKQSLICKRIGTGLILASHIYKLTDQEY